MKLFTDLKTIDEFIKHYKGSGRIELKRRLKFLHGKNGINTKNERRAIEALLA